MFGLGSRLQGRDGRPLKPETDETEVAVMPRSRLVAIRHAGEAVPLMMSWEHAEKIADAVILHRRLEAEAEKQKAPDGAGA